MKELIFSVLYLLRQSTQFINLSKAVTYAGNLDVFFLISLFYVSEFIKKKRIPNLLFGIIIGFILYGTLQLIMIENLDYLKFAINIAKVLICVTILFYSYKHVDYININKVIIIVSALYFGFTIFALIFRNQYLWTINDIVNKYDLSRLKLLYLEPSELGFHVMIIIIFLIGFLVISSQIRTQIILLCCIFANMIVLFFTRSLGAIAFGVAAIAIMLFKDWLMHRSINKDRLYLIVIFTGVVVLAIMALTKSPLILRIIDTLNGQDRSNWYRIHVSLQVTYRAFLESNGLGIGFGNMNTPYFASLYKELGFVQVLANAFLYFVVEAGIFGLIFIIILIFTLARKALVSDSVIKLGLLIFLISYQFFGSHFTNPLIWLLYGFILSNYEENRFIDYQYLGVYRVLDDLMLRVKSILNKVDKI